jgi:hypothetical protein
MSLTETGNQNGVDESKRRLVNAEGVSKSSPNKGNNIFAYATAFKRADFEFITQPAAEQR